MRDSQKGKWGERLINTCRPPASRRTSDVAVRDVEGGWTLSWSLSLFKIS